VFGYKQHTVVDGNGLVIAIEITAANCHDKAAAGFARQSQYSETFAKSQVVLISMQFWVYL
jgi:IS5 family transposase